MFYATTIQITFLSGSPSSLGLDPRLKFWPRNRILVTPPCLAILGEWLMWKTFMIYFTRCIVKNEGISQKLQHNQAAEALHSFRIHEQRPNLAILKAKDLWKEAMQSKDDCVLILFYTRMERQEVVSCTGSASSDLAKPGDDRFHDAVDTDSDDNEGKYCGRLGNSVKHIQARIKADKYYRSLQQQLN
ncbi:hypothetical protein EMCRGX_G007982 [Ephydatia muelleri]